jgi:hypothetical protein
LPMLLPSPAIQASAYLCAVIINEVPIGTTFSLNVVGTTARTFVSVGTSFGFPILATLPYGVAMLWE